MNSSVKRIHPILPVFRITYKTNCVLYTPGKSIKVQLKDADLIEQAWELGKQPAPESIAWQIASWLKTSAQKAVKDWNLRLHSPFKPECLTLYLSNYCNLNCPYCFASEKESRQPDNLKNILPIISEIKVRAAARLVAESCANEGKTFYLVLHGGGEPTIHWNLVKHYERITRQMAHEFGINWLGHIATNGIISEKRAYWLANHFNQVGLSCDGPPDIQDRQRPLEGGVKSSLFVERTARAIIKSGGRIEVRTTITPQTMARQTEIISYLHVQLGATQVRFEPVYRLAGKNIAGFTPANADVFVKHFLAAQKKARSFGCNLSFSGVRLNDLHGPYCDVSRNVLHLTPDGVATACFFCVDTQKLGDSKYEIGRIDESTKEFILKEEQIKLHRHAANNISEFCWNCINIFHCARGCPELCCTAGDPEKLESDFATHFRCRVQKQLAVHWILESSGTIIQRKNNKPKRSLYTVQSENRSIQNYLKSAPTTLDTKFITQQWEAVKNSYDIEHRRMPSPIWAERGYEHDGPEVWKQLKRYVARSQGSVPMSIYLHIPFCEQHCGFCDCYSIPLGKNRAKKEEKYTHALISEIDAWSEIRPIGQRPVTTIHFGGGTPYCLRSDLFEVIIKHCKNCFNVTAETELAIESTGALIAEDHLSHLLQLGFKRIHIGVQTLEEPLRGIIGRKISTSILINRLINAMNKGFITSVDVIYGLPGQTVKSLLKTLEDLVDAGLHGISLYQLNISRRNHWFFKQFKDIKRDALYDYVLYQIADQFLMCSGYQKNHFVHFARPEDHNYYSTHLKRGEDLLGLGASADGVFGHYHYRHPGCSKYLNGKESGRPAFEGGVVENEEERKYGPAIAALMCGGISRQALQYLNAKDLLGKWIDCGLLRKNTDPQEFALSANGSWLVNDMILELRTKAEDLNTSQ
jgi:radical SAM protein with 4Fe4S-binding SPASM domain